jgi:hypothetical protein
VCVESDTVDDRGDQSRVAEHGSPFAEGQIGADADRGAFVTLGDDLEQQLGATRVDLDAAQLVELCRPRHSSIYPDPVTMPTPPCVKPKGVTVVGLWRMG